MKRQEVIAPLLATGLFLSGCSIEGTASAPSADTQLLNAYSDCKVVKATGTDKVITEFGDKYGRVEIDLSATRNPQTDTTHIHYGEPLGNLLLNGNVTKPPLDMPMSWELRAGEQPSQTKVLVQPRLGLFEPNPFNHVQTQHIEVEVYVSAQNTDYQNPKTSERYCGTVSIREMVAGGLEADIVQPLTPPDQTMLRNDWHGDMH